MMSSTIRMAILTQVIFHVCLWHMVIAARLKGNVNTVTVSTDSPCYGFTELENCTCYDRVVDCESLQFSDIPPLPANTTHLIMKNNQFTELKALPQYNELYLLDMSKNEIEFFEANAFTNVPSIQELYLNTNRLNFSEIPSNIFDPLINLKILNIADNFMWRSTDVYRDDLMQNLTSLEDLSMDGLENGTQLGPGFSGLRSLRCLTFSAKMENLTNDTFSHLADLPITSLRIWSGWLATIESHTFVNFPKLKSLDLSYNPHLGFYSAAKAWPGLEFTQIDTLIFNQSTAYGEDIITLNKTFLIGLRKTNITKITINANSIVTMDGGFHRHLPNLQNYQFSYNRLQQVTNVIVDVALMENIVHLDASQQAIRHNQTQKEILAGINLPQDSLKYLSNQLDLNFTEMLADAISDDPRLEQYLPIGDRRIYGRNDELTRLGKAALCMLVGMCIPFPAPCTIETVNLSASLSVAIDTLPFILFLKAENLRYMDYSYNGLVNLAYPIVFSHRFEYNNNMTFNLRGNELQFIGDYYSQPNTKLGNLTETMLLGKNNLGDQLGKYGAQILAGMQFLKVLDLSENAIKDLPSSAFRPLPSLEKLDLSSNSLRQITFDITDLSRLRWLDLSGNLLSYINQTVTEQIDKVANARKGENTTLELYLLDNPFVCSCNTLEFLKWMDHVNHQEADTGLRIQDFHAIMCEYEGEIVCFEELSDIVRELSRQCNLVDILLVTLIPSAFIALVVALSVLAWRHKFDIKFWFLNIVIKRKTAQAREDEKKQRYLYDAFVAYCGPEGSLRWVLDQLIPKMEDCGDASKKLLIHDRDFHLGSPITENIHQGIHQSRKIILVIDKPFLISEWCKYETHVAHHESIDRGRDVIIAVLLEPAAVLLADAYMYHTLKGLLKKRTYIEWPRNTMHQEEFWQRLHKAVQDPIMRPLQCVCGRALDRMMSTEVDTDSKEILDVNGNNNV